MKRLRTMLTVALLLLTASCGDWTINGKWKATLKAKDGSTFSVISMTLHDNGNGTVTITNLTFLTPTPCFPDGTTSSGSWSLFFVYGTGWSGDLALVIQSSSTDSTLTMNTTIGAFDSEADGKWTVTGSTAGCTGNGNFHMYI